MLNNEYFVVYGPLSLNGSKSRILLFYDILLSSTKMTNIKVLQQEDVYQLFFEMSIKCYACQCLRNLVFSLSSRIGKLKSYNYKPTCSMQLKLHSLSNSKVLKTRVKKVDLDEFLLSDCIHCIYFTKIRSDINPFQHYYVLSRLAMYDWFLLTFFSSLLNFRSMHQDDEAQVPQTF